VLLSERNITETALNFTMLARVGQGSVFLGSVFLGDAPMFHTIGLISNTRPALLSGGTCLISEAFEPAVTLARLADPALRPAGALPVEWAVFAAPSPELAEPGEGPGGPEGSTRP